MKKQFFLKVIFILYLVFLVWLVIFKFNFSINDIHKVREVNLIPFHYKNVIEGDFPLMEALFNFIVFIPFGLLLEKIWSGKVIFKIILIAATSLLFEITQYLLSIGASDITDFITNTIGGLVGILIVMLFRTVKKP